MIMTEKTLVLMRHSKALDMYESGAKNDFERPLSQEGISKAKEQAKNLKDALGNADIIAVSPLLRAMQTAQIVAAAFNAEDKIKPFPELADSMAVNGYGEIIKALSAKHSKVILIGHNPAISALARELCGDYVSLSAGDYKIIES